MKHRLTFTSRVFPLGIIVIFALSLLSLIAVDAQAGRCLSDSESCEPRQDNSLLQFKAGNHILGFAPTKVYFASLDHALTVKFLGTRGVMPKAEGGVSAIGKTALAQQLREVVYQNLWEGVSLTYDATGNAITESTYNIAAGADVASIRLKYNVPVELQENGSLKFKFNKGYIAESPPVAWQEIGNKRIPVIVAYKVSGEEVGFRVGKYDASQPLTIDPKYSWNTFYSSGVSRMVRRAAFHSSNKLSVSEQSADDSSSVVSDTGQAIAVDSSDNVYITGQSQGTWNGPNGQLPLNAFAGSQNIFVLKLNSSGQYLWHTFYGSGVGDEGQGIAVDGNGNIYVAGYSIAAWNGPSGQIPLNAFTGGSDTSNSFVLSLNSSGTYQWHTFYGSGDDDAGQGIAVDSNANVYVTGYSAGPWNGPSGQAPINAFNDNNSSGILNIFVLSLNSSGAYQWHTFYGSGIADEGQGIAVDRNANVYVTGDSLGTWNGPSGQPPVNAFSGSSGISNIFVLSLNSSGAYQWHTFYGSGIDDEGQGIVVDSNANVYVTGYSSGTWNGPSGQAPINPFPGSSGAAYPPSTIFVLSLNSSGTYQWHTFYGSGIADDGQGIAVDSSANVYVTGYSSGSWNGPSGQAPLNTFAGSSGTPDIVILNLSSGGAYQWHTFYGAGYGDEGQGIAVDSSGNVDVTGWSDSMWGDPLNPFVGGFSDIFVLQLQLSTCPGTTAVQVVSTSVPYDSIQDAYDALASAGSSGQTILIQALQFTGGLTLYQDIAVTLVGGYECNFPSAPPGLSTIGGVLIISGGTVTVENLILQ